MLAQMLTAIIDDIQGETVTLKELMEKAGREDAADHLRLGYFALSDPDFNPRCFDGVRGSHRADCLCTASGLTAVAAQVNLEKRTQCPQADPGAQERGKIGFTHR